MRDYTMDVDISFDDTIDTFEVVEIYAANK